VSESPDRDLPLPADVPEPEGMCDGGDLDCGSGLLLIIRKAMEPVAAGAVLEVRSRERSVREDLPAWCRLVGHTMVTTQDAPGDYVYYFVRKKADDEDLQQHLQEARDHAWQVRVRWTGGMLAKAFARNHSFVVGQPASFDTEDEAPSAVEYLLGAVAGALATGFQWRLSQKGVSVHNLEVKVNARSENILVFLGLEEGSPALEAVEGRVFVDCDGEEEVVNELFEETLRRCPVTRTLSREVPVNVEMRRT
jgi:uncharacterized OsmC-like protein/TusA-related sulfurtransferase